MTRITNAKMARIIPRIGKNKEGRPTVRVAGFMPAVERKLVGDTGRKGVVALVSPGQIINWKKAEKRIHQRITREIFNK